MTKAQKILKRKSRGRITPHLEHEVLYLLNGLAGKPERIEIPKEPIKSSIRVETLQAELEELLGMLPVDETHRTCYRRGPCSGGCHGLFQLL